MTEALRRIGTLLASMDDARLGASEHAETLRRLREEIDLLWRTAALRVQAMRPLDEVRTVMAAFDETLFRVVPVLYRSLDRALQGPRSGDAAAVAPAFLRFGSWVGADRDGNPFVTAQVTRETAEIQADHALRALQNVTARVGRALTVQAEPALAGPAITGALAAAGRAHPDLLAEITARSPGEPYRAYLLYAARRLRATRLAGTGPDETRRAGRGGQAGPARPAWLTAARPNSSRTCASCKPRSPGRAPPGRRSASSST